MKKIVLILLLLLCGCGKKEVMEQVETVIESKNNIVIGINYPQTNISKLDKTINEYIDKIYIGFKDEYDNIYSLKEMSELNIDYQYKIVNDRYLNIILYTFINSSTLAHPINEMTTFVFDTKSNRFLTLESLISEKELQRIAPTIKQRIISKYKDCALMDMVNSKVNADFNNYPHFTFNSTDLTLYFNPYILTSGNCGIIDVNLKLSDLNLKIPINEELEQNFSSVDIIGEKVIDPSKPVVAITFDDGPSKYTDKILDLLEQNHANATFFVLGNKVKIYSDTINKSIRLGNEIGNHSYNHKWLTSLSKDEFNNQIDKTNNLIKEISGYDCRLLRPTYGSINKKIRNNTNMDIVLWTVDSNDWKIKNAEKIAANVLRDIGDGDIVLFHDTHERTFKALEIIIPKLIEEGYQLVTVSELKQVNLLRKNPT